MITTDEEEDVKMEDQIRIIVGQSVFLLFFCHSMPLPSTLF